MGLNSNHNKLQYSSIPNGNDYNVHPLDDSHYHTDVQRSNGRMATLLKLLYTSWLANILGGGLFTTWLIIDFNDLKAIVVGCMSLIWLAGRGIISLYRLWIKAQREKWELDRDKTDHHKPEIQKRIKSQSK